MKKPRADPALANIARRDLQQLWLSLMREKWSSIVVVPAEAKISARAVTQALADGARVHEVNAFKLVDAQGASIADGERLAKELASTVAAGGRVVIGVDSLMESLGGIPLVKAADKAVLVVGLGETDFASARSTIDIVGREKIVGCVALRPGS